MTTNLMEHKRKFSFLEALEEIQSAMMKRSESSDDNEHSEVEEEEELLLEDTIHE